MDVGNRAEAQHETLDIPGICSHYERIVKTGMRIWTLSVKSKITSAPTFVYQSVGYAMLAAAIQNGWLSGQRDYIEITGWSCHRRCRWHLNYILQEKRH